MLSLRFLKDNSFASILIAIGLCLCLIFYPFASINSTPFEINVNSKQTLVGRIYTPKYSSEPLPVVILGHGMSSSKEMVIPLAIELARNKIAAIVFDFGGFGESYPLPSNQQSVASLSQSTVKDAQAILNYIQTQGDRFNQEQIAIVGHSMGGVTAIDLATKDSRLKATVSIGIGGEADINVPANLLFAIGIYEQLNPPATLRPLLASATKNPDDCLSHISQNVCGDFSQGNARKLFISPTADHFTSIYDPILMQEIITWLKQSWQLNTPILSPVMSQFIIGVLLSFVGLIIICTDIFIVYNWVIKLRLLPLAIALLFLVGRLNENWFYLASHLIIILFCLILISNYAYCYPKEWLSRFKTAALYGLLILSAFLIPSVIQNGQELINYPINIVYLPLFVIQWFFLCIYNLFVKFKVIMFPAYTFQLNPSNFMILVLISEAIKPCIIIGIIEKIGVNIVHWLRQPFKLGIKNISTKELQLLSILIIILSCVIWLRFHDGLLYDAIEAGWLVIRLFILFILTPIIITVIGIRAMGRSP